MAASSSAVVDAICDSPPREVVLSTVSLAVSSTIMLLLPCQLGNWWYDCAATDADRLQKAAALGVAFTIQHQELDAMACSGEVQACTVLFCSGAYLDPTSNRTNCWPCDLASEVS